MDREEQINEIKNTIAFVYKLSHDISSMRRESGYRVNDDKTKSRIQSVLSRTGEDLESIIGSLERELDEL